MKTFRVSIEMQSQSGYVEIEAESEDEAEENFQNMCADQILNMSGIIPEYEIDGIDEVKGDN